MDENINKTLEHSYTSMYNETGKHTMNCPDTLTTMEWLGTIYLTACNLEHTCLKQVCVKVLLKSCLCVLNFVIRVWV